MTSRFVPRPRLRVVVPVREEGPTLYDRDGYVLDAPVDAVVVSPLVYRGQPQRLPCGVDLVEIGGFRAWPVDRHGDSLAPPRLGHDPAQLVADVLEACAVTD